MTMEIEVKNKSENYVGKVIELYHYPNTEETRGSEYILNPGESKSLYVHDGMSLRVEEMGEYKVKKADSEDLPPENGEPITDEEKLYSEKTWKVEPLGAYFMLVDYSGEKAPDLYCGRSMKWTDSLVIPDPFFTREEAVKAGLAL